MFLGLNDQFQENLAEAEMIQILDLIQMQIMQTLLLPTKFNQTSMQKIELPTLLGKMFRYTIEISNLSNNQLILHGFSNNLKIDQVITFSVAPKYNIEISKSSFQSINSILSLYIEKNLINVIISIS